MGRLGILKAAQSTCSGKIALTGRMPAVWIAGAHEGGCSLVKGLRKGLGNLGDKRPGYVTAASGSAVRESGKGPTKEVK